jgi:hypothetical protein
MRVGSLLVFVVACKSGSKDAAPAAASGSATPKPVPNDPAPAKPLEPAVKPTHIDGVGGEKPFDITLPPNVKATVDPGGDEQLPSARFEGGGLTFTVERPEYWPEVGWAMADEKGTIDRGSDKVTYERTDDRGDTWTMIYKQAARGSDAASYTVDVAFRKAGLMCRASEVDSRSTADRIAAICETLAPGKK